MIYEDLTVFATIASAFMPAIHTFLDMAVRYDT